VGKIITRKGESRGKMHVFDSDVKKIFGDGKVLLVVFPPAMTEVIQPIYAGYGRSTRCCIGNELDRWLMDTSNLEKGKQT